MSASQLPPAKVGGPGRSPGRTIALWLAVVFGLGLLMFAYHHLGAIAEGDRPPVAKALINELTAALGAGTLYWGIRALVLTRPLTRTAWLGRLPLYLVALGAYSLLHTSSNWALRTLLYPLAGLGPYDYGRMPMRYVMELPIDVIGFTLMVGAVQWASQRRERRQRELRAERLERTLTEAKLANLRLQLQPHFLFNALNTISSTMYRDVGRADELIERLGDLLRGSLSTARDDLVPLARELEWLAAYVELLEARFEERLEIAIDVPDELRRAVVPAMLIQPLVENAVRHGGVERHGTGRIRIAGHREDGYLLLSVADDGPGAAGPVDPHHAGFGLRSVAERLQLLFGDDHGMELGSPPGGGFTATLRFPYREEEGA
ncbi:MAG: histidine kinase [Thermoanaerobaculia bacterium]